jgi:hypothetical protein
MHTFLLYHLSRSSRLRRALSTLALELRTLVSALANPNQVIDEVKAMQALMKEAGRLEATQPARAAVLRHRAARMGL